MFVWFAALRSNPVNVMINDGQFVKGLDCPCPEQWKSVGAVVMTGFCNRWTVRFQGFSLTRRQGIEFFAELSSNILKNHRGYVHD